MVEVPGLDTVHPFLPHLPQHHDVAVAVRVFDLTLLLCQHVVGIPVHMSVTLCENRPAQSKN